MLRNLCTDPGEIPIENFKQILGGYLEEFQNKSITGSQKTYRSKFLKEFWEQILEKKNLDKSREKFLLESLKKSRENPGGISEEIQEGIPDGISGGILDGKLEDYF